MAEWNAAQYLKFKAERTQPALDLARRLSLLSPDTVLDIGCGPGNSTAVLKDLFPNADITGIDKSEAMLKRRALLIRNSPFCSATPPTLFNP